MRREWKNGFHSRLIEDLESSRYLSLALSASQLEFLARALCFPAIPMRGAVKPLLGMTESALRFAAVERMTLTEAPRLDFIGFRRCTGTVKKPAILLTARCDEGQVLVVSLQ